MIGTMHPYSRESSHNLWKKALGVYLGVALLALSFFAGLELGFIRGSRAAVPPGQGRLLNAGDASPDYLSRDVDFGLYWRVWNLLKDQYIDRPVSDTALFYGSLEGMVGALEDPYTVFLDPATTGQFTSELAGTFEGIGAEIGIKDDLITVIAPLPGTPAEEAGLLAGDRIVQIDGVLTAGMTVEEAVTRIRGPGRTDVVLTIFRDGVPEPWDVTITRATITVESVRYELREDEIALIHLYQFGDDTASDFRRIVLDVLTDSPRGIVLDLRNNPGGFLDAAVDVAGEWIPKPNLVVIEQNERRVEFRSEGPARLKDIPTVVLVGGGTASGAEILAGALQDYGIAPVVGTQTFGKGSVQD
ncbi:S41 family peptidase, partial [Candidatus Uhrbacteria bacterium]|nr:S41 family peptidase [Candidatus Uhrbacteria bacterium]